MADQNDYNDNLVGLPDAHDKSEDAPLDWRDLLHEHLKASLGKTYRFDLPQSDRGLYALKPSAFFALPTDEAKRMFDAIMAMPSAVVLFENGEPTDAAPKLETAREHNERKYPDLMKRIDALANRSLNSDDDDA